MVSWNLFPMTNLRPKVELMHTLPTTAHAQTLPSQKSPKTVQRAGNDVVFIDKVQ